MDISAGNADNPMIDSTISIDVSTGFFIFLKNWCIYEFFFIDESVSFFIFLKLMYLWVFFYFVQIDVSVGFF